jgi:chromosome segregation ATPase
MSERKQRTPAEIIAETEAKLSRLRVKAARQDAKSNPAVAPLLEELEALRKDIREAKKGLGDGPQSFNARVEKHDAWIVKIEEERETAEETLSNATERKTEIEAEITQVVNGLVVTEVLSSAASTPLSADA